MTQDAAVSCKNAGVLFRAVEVAHYAGHESCSKILEGTCWSVEKLKHISYLVNWHYLR